MWPASPALGALHERAAFFLPRNLQSSEVQRQLGMRKKSRDTNISHIAEATTVLWWLALQSPGNFYYWRQQCLTWPLWTPCRFHQFYPRCLYSQTSATWVPPYSTSPPPPLLGSILATSPGLCHCRSARSQLRLPWLTSPLCVDLGLSICLLLAWLLSLASAAVCLPVLRSWCPGSLRGQPMPRQMPVGLDLAPSLVLSLYHWAGLQLAPSAAHPWPDSLPCVHCHARTSEETLQTL